MQMQMQQASHLAHSAAEGAQLRRDAHFFLSRTGGSRASRCDTNRVDEGVGCHHGAGDGPGWSGGRPASRRLEDACGCGCVDASAAHLAGVASVAGFQVAFQCSSGGLSQVGLVAGRAQSQYMLPRRPWLAVSGFGQGGRNPAEALLRTGDSMYSVATWTVGRSLEEEAAPRPASRCRASVFSSSSPSWLADTIHHYS